MESVFEKGGSSAVVGRAVAVIDAAIADCAAWEYARMTRERMRGHSKSGGLDRKVVKLTNHSELFHLAIDLGVKTFAPREWLTKAVWKILDEDTMIVCYEAVEDGRFPVGAGKGYMRASSVALWRYERLPEIRGIPQTRVTYIQQADLKGFIPPFVLNSKLTGALEYVSEMRKKFDKSLEIDAGCRAELVQMIELTESSGSKDFAQFEALYNERQGWQRPSSR